MGWRDGPVIRATGIRYARASRFQPPMDEPRAHGSIDATQWSPACAQAQHELGAEIIATALRPLTTTEDCLRLSITLPGDIEPGDSRPVMVWIHGGSYVFGAGDAAIFDPRAIVEEQGVIVVCVTYRLGLFGFLGGSAGRAANVGLLDIIAALRWVNRNIRAFGGMPDDVTLFGQSAGGDAIAHLMITAEAQGEMPDINYLIAIDTRYIGEAAGQVKDDELVELVFRFMNSYLRSTLNARLSARLRRKCRSRCGPISGICGVAPSNVRKAGRKNKSGQRMGRSPKRKVQRTQFPGGVLGAKPLTQP